MALTQWSIQFERLSDSLNFHPTGESRPSVVTFGVNYDGFFTRKALSFMNMLATIKYPET
jgi:hypothetical protein